MKRPLLIFLSLIVVMSVNSCSIANNGQIIEVSPFYSLQGSYNNNMIKRRDLKTK